ncbi:MAG: PilW family protein [Burkholderiaceae bacterium]|nr:PilW family protein [Burkholderiaceae bacterium]
MKAIGVLPGRAQRGVSLIELLVGIVIGLFLALSVLKIQQTLVQANYKLSDTYLRDNELRSAMDMVGQDLAGAGFVMGGVQPQCGLILAYDSAAPISGVFGQFPVSSTWQTTTSQLMTTGTLPTGASALGTYPTITGSGTVSQVLSITTTATALTAAAAAGAPLVYSVVQNASITSVPNSSTSGPIAGLANLPISSTTGINYGAVGYLRLHLSNGTNTSTACFRVRVPRGANAAGTALAAGSSLNIQDPNLMPGTGLNGYSATLGTYNILASGTNLVNASLLYGRLYYPMLNPPDATLIAGVTASTNQQVVVYYVGMSNGTTAAAGNFPVLYRAVVNALDDSLITAPVPVAAGVVSLQALYGVDETGSGNVTNYLTWADVLAGNFTANVRTVLFSMVAKSLQSDATPGYAASPNPVPIPSPSGTGNDAFTAYTIPAAYNLNHFTVMQSEVAIRNQLWQR